MAYDSQEALFNSFFEDDDDSQEALFSSFFDDSQEEPEYQPQDFEASPAPEPAVEPVEEEEKDTEYNWAGALKQAGYQTLRAMGGSLPAMVGKIIPGDDPIERIGKENKAVYDEWMKGSPDVQKHQQSVSKETEGFLPEVIGSIGPTLAGLTTSIIPVVGPYLAAAEFLDLNKEEIYEQAKAKGADEETAAIVSWTGGAINSALDMTGLGALKRVFKPGKKITKFLVNYALATQVEGGTESVQDVVGKVATEYSIKPKDESESDFMARMWDKKDELVADAWHAYTIGAGTTALLGVPAGVHQGVTGGLKGDVDPTRDEAIANVINNINDPEQPQFTQESLLEHRGDLTDNEIDHIFKQTSTDETAKIQDQNAEKLDKRSERDAVLDQIENGKPVDSKIDAAGRDAQNAIQRLEDSKRKKAASVVEKAEVLVKKQTAELEAAELSKQQVANDLIAEEETLKAKEAASGIEPDYAAMVDQIEEGTMVDMDITDQDGNITTEKVDAKTALKDINDRHDTFNKILNCISG